MKKILMLFLLVTMTACSSMPAKKDTPMAHYNKLVVRQINWNETAISEIEGEEVKEYIAAQPRLAEIFRSEFEKYINETAVFEKVGYGDAQVDADTLILEPKIYDLSPGIRGVKLGSATYTGLLKTADGKLVGKYTSERRVNRPLFSTMMGTLETLARELGEDAASRVLFAK